MRQKWQLRIKSVRSAVRYSGQKALSKRFNEHGRWGVDQERKSDVQYCLSCSWVQRRESASTRWEWSWTPHLILRAGNRIFTFRSPSSIDKHSQGWAGKVQEAWERDKRDLCWWRKANSCITSAVDQQYQTRSDQIKLGERSWYNSPQP